MNYLNQLNEDISTAEKMIVQANNNFKMAVFKKECFEYINNISMNSKYAYQIVSYFEFDNFFASSEFTDNEKLALQKIIEAYRNSK